MEELGGVVSTFDGCEFALDRRIDLEKFSDIREVYLGSDLGTDVIKMFCQKNRLISI